MIALAFGLGFAGSLHCLGMCGPLVLGVASNIRSGIVNRWIHGLLYHFSRVLTYGFMGIMFGLLGKVLAISGFQKTITITSGIFLVVLFLFTIDLETLIFKSKKYQRVFRKFQQHLTRTFSSLAQRHPFVLGILNAILPCGLVYLALMGSLTTGSALTGMAFMVAFGLGTLPMMLSIHFGVSMIKWRPQGQYKKIFPLLHLVLGIFLIYRGWVVDMPMELDFLSAIKNPILCH